MNKLLNIIKIILITSLVVIMIMIFAYQQTHYVRVGHVTLGKVHGVENEYIFSDSTGQEFAFITTDIISPYDTIKVTMFDNCTEENIYDDMVVNYKVVSNSDSEN